MQGAKSKSAVLVQFRDRKIVALLDSGASRSIVSHKFVQRFKLNISPLTTGDALVLKTANGEPMNVLGKITLDIKINGLITPYEFYVLQNISHDLIVGLDHLMNNKC